jgi:2-oxoglutarate dehydrogenase E2 component (dihydrolipoamide succinyltransferase)
MSIKIVMPQLGESIHEGTIGKWLKREGDSVKEFEPILEVTTDKVDTEVTAAGDGILLKIEIPTGTTVGIGTVLGYIGEQGEPAESASGHSGGAATPPAQTAPENGSNGHDLGFISPVVAKLAAEYKLNLAQIKGTGLAGRITKKDVLAFVESKSTAPIPAQPLPLVVPQPSIAPSRSTPSVVTSGLPTPHSSLSSPLSTDTVLPLSTMRRAIAEHMVRSKATSPHVTTVFEADLSKIVAHRTANKAQFERDGINLTYTAYFVAATVAALKAYPVVNSVFADDKLLLKRDINIGLAVALGDEGLIVPVLKAADEKSLLAIARSVNDLSTRARAKQLKPDEVQGSTFTITNHGVSGSLFATPIINQPQCGILGVGAIQKRVVVLTDSFGNDSIAIRPMCYISLTFDHRSLDGATADFFVAKIKDTLERWS